MSLNSQKTDMYIKLDPHVRTHKMQICMADMAGIYCADEKLKQQAENTVIFSFENADNKKKVISLIYIYSALYQKLGDEMQIHSLGAEDCLIELTPEKKKSRIKEILLVALVSLVVFFGAAFSIMTYNEDASVEGVFETFYEMFTGEPTGNGVLELSYSIGIGLGIIVFFHHFEKKNQRTPTAMEIQMNKYEKDVVDSYIKTEERRGKSLEVEK